MSCVPIEAPADAAADADADVDAGCLPIANTFDCFSTADCPDSPAPPGDWLAGPVACCVSGFIGIGSGCEHTGLFDCGLFASRACTTNAECSSGKTCTPVVANGVTLPLSVCH